jgi:hypothetical protein
MTSTLRGLVNRVRRPERFIPAPSPAWRWQDPKFVVLKVCGEIPQRHRWEGWQMIMDLTEEGWVAHRYKDELWLYSLPILPELEEMIHGH